MLLWLGAAGLMGLTSGSCLSNERLALLGLGAAREKKASAAAFCGQAHRNNKSCVDGAKLEQAFNSRSTLALAERKEALDILSAEEQRLKEKLAEAAEIFEGKESAEVPLEQRVAYEKLKRLVSALPGHVAAVLKDTVCAETQLALYRGATCTLTSTTASGFIFAEEEGIELSVEQDVARKAVGDCRAEIDLLCALDGAAHSLWTLGRLTKFPPANAACGQLEAFAYAARDSDHARLLTARVFEGVFAPGRVSLLDGKVAARPLPPPAGLLFRVKPNALKLSALFSQ